MPNHNIAQRTPWDAIDEINRDVDYYGRYAVWGEAFAIDELNYLSRRLKSQGIKSVDVFHVTRTDPGLLVEQGILGSELDYIGGTTGNLRPSSVYAFLDPSDAIKAVKLGVLGRGEMYVVRVKLPIENISKMFWDSNFNVTFGFATGVGIKGDLPGSYIDGVALFDGQGNQIAAPKLSAASALP